MSDRIHQVVIVIACALGIGIALPAINPLGGTQHDWMTIMGIFAAGVRNVSHVPGVAAFGRGAGLRGAAICAILRLR